MSRNGNPRKSLIAILVVGSAVVGAGVANADPVTFSTTGVLSASGTNVEVFGGLTTLTFNSTTDAVNPGTTTIQGTVTGAAVPESASMVLLGTGLAALAGAARRRRAKS